MKPFRSDTNYGFAFELTNAEQIRSGKYNVAQPENPQEFIGFVDIFSVDRGDKLDLSIIDQEGSVLIARAHKFGKYQARYFFLSFISYSGPPHRQP